MGLFDAPDDISQTGIGDLGAEYMAGQFDDPEERQRRMEQYFSGQAGTSTLPPMAANDNKVIQFEDADANYDGHDPMAADHRGVGLSPAGQLFRGTGASGENPARVVKAASSTSPLFDKSDAPMTGVANWASDSAPTSQVASAETSIPPTGADIFAPEAPRKKKKPEDLAIGESMVLEPSAIDLQRQQSLKNLFAKQQQVGDLSDKYYKELNHWYTPLLAAALPAYGNLLWHKGNELIRQHQLARQDYATEVGRQPGARFSPDSGLEVVEGRTGDTIVRRFANPRLTRAQEATMVDEGSGDTIKTKWNPEKQTFEPLLNPDGSYQVVKKAVAPKQPRQIQQGKFKYKGGIYTRFDAQTGEPIAGDEPMPAAPTKTPTDPSERNALALARMDFEASNRDPNFDMDQAYADHLSAQQKLRGKQPPPAAGAGGQPAKAQEIPMAAGHAAMADPRFASKYDLVKQNPDGTRSLSTDGGKTWNTITGSKIPGIAAPRKPPMKKPI